MDPYGKGIIDDRALLGEVLAHLDRPVSAEVLDEVWAQLDDDGNGYASFAEFVQWAGEQGIELPVGLDDAAEQQGSAKLPGVGRECGFLGCSCRCFKPRPEQERFCQCGHKRGLHAAPDDQSTTFAVPPYWQNAGNTGVFSEWVDGSEEELSAIQTVVNASVKRVWTRDRGRDAEGKQKPVPSGYTVVQVQRNENSKIWRKYALKKALIKQGVAQEGGDTPAFERFGVKTARGAAASLSFMEAEPLDLDCNEWFLWHGTSHVGARKICETDFQQRLAGSATGTLYGPGTYFAESCSKADEYAREVTEGDGLFTMLLCRVIGGRVKYTDEAEPVAADLTDAVLHGPYDSVLGDREKCRNTFREFVAFGSDQAYPEYIVTYNRSW
eukprot:NODE_265_length_1724_cov_286.436189.p1 GENE.NODE_265_length_1724_cov_286.436189~~NODE_265_length_1724_cov_286.436189.p1  ORF type:complete len:383 (+),score=68.29 NODE_265_length_1724_cov_286.436189:310-1458(+)